MSKIRRRIAEFHQYAATKKGGPEVLYWQQFTPAAPQAGESGVRVEASGVLLADVLWQMWIKLEYGSVTLNHILTIHFSGINIFQIS